MTTVPSATQELGHPRLPTANGLALLMVVGILAANLVASLPGLDIATRQLYDTDGYMRVVRVTELMSGENGWFDGFAHRANAPIGHSMHWTRPLDAVLVLMALPFVPFVGLTDAVYWAALLSGPLLHLALGLAVAWAARPLVAKPAAFLAALAVSVQPVILAYSGIGRADHHILILLCAVMLGGATIRLLVSPAIQRPYAMVGGLAAAGGMWVSTEFLLPLGLVLGGGGLAWVAGGDNHYIASQRKVWLTASIATAAALVAERGLLDLGAVEYDRISLPHLAVPVLATGFWLLVGRLPEGVRVRLGPRMVVAALLGVGAAGIMRGVFPVFFRGPFADVPSELNQVWLSRVAELQPLIGDEQRLTDAIFILGGVITGLVACLLVVIHLRRSRLELTGWLFVLGWLVITTALTVRSVRFGVYPQALAAIPTTWWGWRLMVRYGSGRGLAMTAIRLGTMAAVVVGFAVLVGGARVVDGPPPADPEEGEQVCELPAMAAVLSSLPRTNDQPLVVLANGDFGPELLYRTGLWVVATPYHRNVDGILDVHRAFLGDPQTVSRGIIERRGVDFVLICPSYDQGEGLGKETLFARLLADDPPSYLRPLALPAEPGDLFRLYAVQTGGIDA